MASPERSGDEEVPGDRRIRWEQFVQRREFDLRMREARGRYFSRDEEDSVWGSAVNVLDGPLFSLEDPERLNEK